MQRALPDALDLLTISVEAGLGFDAALMHVARNTSGPLAQELSRLLQEMQIGVGRAEAMRAVAERSTIKELRSFCLAMVQADRPRDPRRAGPAGPEQGDARQAPTRGGGEAQQVPVKIMIPLVLFVLPCLLIVIGGPAALQVMDSFR